MSESTENTTLKLNELPKAAANQAEYEARKAAYKARHSSVSYRAGYAQHLHVDVPSHVHYEWVRNDPLDIDEMSRKGFIVDTEFACNTNIHGSRQAGTPTVVQGAICMITPKENKEALDELYLEAMYERHGKPGKSRVIEGKDEDKDRVAGVTDIPEDLNLIEEANNTHLVGSDEVMEHIREKSQG